MFWLAGLWRLVRVTTRAITLPPDNVDKILRGASPADLPIAGPTKFTLSVSRTALGKLGVLLPPDLSARVNEWVD
jgi:ABC-type uncharacterized transport system substrate-binding protein